jgi:hypothetical protein
MHQLASLVSNKILVNQVHMAQSSALHIKLKCFGIPIGGATNMFCNNNAVVKNVSLPESTLSKKHNAINFHIIWESVAAKIICVGKEDTLTNIADIFTKLVPFTRKMEINPSQIMRTIQIQTVQYICIWIW